MEMIDDRDRMLRLKGRRQGLEDPLDRFEKDRRHDDVDGAFEFDDEGRFGCVGVVEKQRAFFNVTLKRCIKQVG